jgi:hypothetical protein
VRHAVKAPLFAAIALLLLAGGPARAAPVTRFAVVVGNNIGQARSEPLKYAERDASRMAVLLEEIGGVRPENILLIEGGKPDDLRDAMDRMSDRIGKAESDAVFIFYYSGHADSGWLRMGGRGIQLSELRRRLELMPAKVRVAIVDACQSGEITRAKGGKVVSPFLEERPVNVEGMVILTSASAAEPAQESDVLRSSFFSHHLMSGLRGPADTSGDGRVSASEAYDYAYRYTVLETEGSTSGAQHPTFLYALEGEGDVTLTAVRTGRARIDLAAGLAGTVLFVGAGEQIEAEVVKRGGEQVTVALVPGSYDVRWRAPDKLWTARVRLRHGDQLSLDQDDFTEQPLVAVVDKGALPPAQSVVPTPEVGRSEPTPLTDVPLGGGSGWKNGGAAPVPGPAPQQAPPAEAEGPPEPDDDPLASDNGDPYEREFDDSRSFGKHPDALLWPPVMAAIGFVGPGVPQILDRKYGQGAAILGVTVVSLAGAGLLGWSAHSSAGDSDEVTGVKLVGATAFGFTAFYSYSYGIIDAFYSNTRGGPGKPDLDELDLDLALAVAPSLARTTDGVKLTAGGGLGAGLAVHRNVVIGLRNLSGTYGHGVGSFQFGPELRLRGMFLERLGWSVSVGSVVQVQREVDLEVGDGSAVDESKGRWDWAMYPYLAGMVHYFPARSWSLDFGVRTGVAVGTRRLLGEVAQPQAAASVEYIGGLTWYY